MPNELLHELHLRHTHVLDGVRRQKSILNVQKRGLGFLGSAPGYKSEVTGFLRVAGEKNSPAAIGNAVHVIMAGMHVKRLRCEGAGADMEYNRKALPGNRIEDFLHQDQSLSRSEVGNASARYRETLTRAGCAVFGFGFDESQLFSPKVARAVGHFGLVPATHGRGRSDRVRTRALSDMSFDPNHHSRPVRSRGNTWKWGFLLG